MSKHIRKKISAKNSPHINYVQANYIIIFSVTTLANPPTFTVGTESIIDIRTTGTALNLGDDSMSGLQSLGFNFTFYGQTFNQVNISMNGFLHFKIIFRYLVQEIIGQRFFLPHLLTIQFFRFGQI